MAVPSSALARLRDPAPLVLDAVTRRRLERLASRGYPFETCGLLVGRATAESIRVLRVTEARNVAPERQHDRYVLDPGHYVAVDSEARARGLDIVGVWHTHPDHPAHPSPTDHASAWEGFHYLILAVGRHGVTSIRSWSFTQDRFLRQTIEEVFP